MRIQSLAIVATSALLTLTAVVTASAQVVTTQSRIDSDGLTTCKSVKQTSSGPFGSSSVSKRVCSSGMGFPGPSPVGGLGGGGGRGGGGININVQLPPVFIRS